MQPKDFRPEDLFSQIQSLVNDLEAERLAREAAEAADAATSNLLAMVGRELRPPVEAIVAMAELLRASQLDPSQRRYTETLAQSARSPLAALKDVLDFSMLEAGQVELATKRVDLHALVKSVASVLRARASEKGLMSSVDMGAHCPRFIVGDEVRVRQVLMSLIEAALQSTSEGSVRLYVSVNHAEDPLTVRFDITDTGAGLGKAEEEDLFQPSAGATRSEDGFALPIARRFAEAMGGQVGCDSALGQGTLYWFTLQAARAEDEDETQAEEAGDTIPKGTLAGHVLTVNRVLIGAYLDEFGLTCEMVENGAAAIMCLAVRNDDLVLMDTVLPDYDGVQIAKRIRALHAPLSTVPIVALAAPGAKGADQDYVELGMNAQVPKPIEGRALYVALAPFLAALEDGAPIAEAS